MAPKGELYGGKSPICTVDFKTASSLSSTTSISYEVYSDDKSWSSESERLNSSHKDGGNRVQN